MQKNNYTLGVPSGKYQRRELVYLWNVPIQIFAICYITLEVYKGFRYRKGWRSTLEKKLLYILGQFHFYKNITTCLEVIYQAWDAVFHHQMKHREDWKYDAKRSIFDELLGVLSGDETLCQMLDSTSQTKWFSKEK